MSPRVLAVAACACVLMAHPVWGSASPRQVKWEELSTVVGKTVSIAMPGAVVITGKATAVEPDALVVNVTKTTDAKAFPRGVNRVPRSTLHTLEMRTKGSKYRILGTVIGVAGGAVVGALVAIKIGGILDQNHENTQANVAFAGILGVGTAGGYLLGNAADRRSTTIEILP